MTKTKFATEYELNASNRMLFPYLSTANGLADWFADDVRLDDDKVTFNFIWNGGIQKARRTVQKTNQQVRFEFLTEKKEEKKDNAYIEFKLDTNDITQTSFLKIVDYTDIDDPKDLKEMWNNLVAKLKEIVGG